MKMKFSGKDYDLTKRDDQVEVMNLIDSGRARAAPGDLSNLCYAILNCVTARRSTDIECTPYRTPACDRHLDQNESNQCPWCAIKEVERQINGLRVLMRKVLAGELL